MSTDPTPTVSATAAARARSPWRRLLRDPQAVIAGSILLTLTILGLLGPVLRQHDPNFANLRVAFAPAGTPGHLFGGDPQGRDILARLLASVNTSLTAGLIGACVAVTVGVTFGLIAGYFGKKTGAILEWVFNLLQTFPGILLLIVLMPVTRGDFRATMFIYGFLLAPNIFRVVRNLVTGVRREMFVDAALVAGLPTRRILARHILFVVRGPIIISSTFLFGGAIGVQAGLAFLGVGSREIPSFGGMVSEGFSVLARDASQFLWPAITLGLLTSSVVLMGNSLRDAFQGSRPKSVRMVAGLGAKKAPQSAEAVEVSQDAPLLQVRDLTIAYPAGKDEQGGDVLNEVVRGISFDMAEGEVLGLVGESGSGKTQTAFSILGVLPPEAVVVRGSIRFQGVELIGRSDKEMSVLRGSGVAYIPQEPMSNLDPAYTVGSQLVEAVRHSRELTRKQAVTLVKGLLARVGIVDPDRTFGLYPHQISGGMAQRVLIAGAVASRPKLLIADEPTTALDVTVQAEILDLLRDLQQELGMAVLLVTHNFGVVADLSDRMVVMRQGEIVETNDTRTLFATPQHEYTQMLLRSILEESTVREDVPADYLPDVPGPTTDNDATTGSVLGRV